jgi:hypothetical protein
VRKAESSYRALGFLFITANAEQKQDNTGFYSVALQQGGVRAMAAAARAMVFDPRAYLEQQAVEQRDRAEEKDPTPGTRSLQARSSGVPEREFDGLARGARGVQRDCG